GIIFSPQETIQHSYICPRCGKKLTIGVMHRVEELADRQPGESPLQKIPFKNLIPLNEIIAQAINKTAECKSVWDIYFHFIHELGNEHQILTEIPIQDLARLTPLKVSTGIDRMRKGKVKIIPGHDGCYGQISLFESEASAQESEQQLKLF
ncbi:MAG: DNA helicase UvrD, partial [Candidatus Aminicenantales bacterium]